ncbi:MAG: ADP-ribosylglycohydrolase family protein [Clostridiales bacterium]|nr:ADP-ribosylglycohydrolase family protein [Clostridiales bacterium]
MTIGDALGVPYELCRREEIAKSPCVDMVGHGAYNKPAGTWSDDTSMTLALMDGIALCRRYCEMAVPRKRNYGGKRNE